MSAPTISPAASLSLIRRAVIAMAVLACLFQGQYALRNFQTLIAVFLCAAGTLLLLTVLDAEKLADNPLSSLLVMGFGLTHFFCPLVFTSIVGRPVAYRMVVPHLVFGWALVTFACLIIFHKVYCNAGFVQRARIRFQKRFLTPIGLFTPPQVSQLWVMGAMGLVSTYLAVKGGGGEKEGGIMMKVIDSFRPFSFAPFMLLVRPVWGWVKKLEFAHIAGLLCFTAGTFFIAMASGSRGYVVLGFASAGLVYFLGLCTGAFPKPNIRPVPAVIGTILCLVLGPLLMRTFQAAQASVKADTSLSLSQRFDQFWEGFQDTEALQDYEETTEAQMQLYGLWDEDYTGNEFLNRLANPRLHDNLMNSVYALSEDDLAAVRDFDYQRALAILPAPILQALGVVINKDEAIGGSVADYIWMLKNNNPWTFGEFKAGSLMASTYCYAGPIFPLLIAIMALPVFFIIDLLALRLQMTPKGFKTVISMMGCLQGYAYFSIFSTCTTMESPSALLGAVTRGFAQAMVLYLVVFHLTRRRGSKSVENIPAYASGNLK